MKENMKSILLEGDFFEYVFLIAMMAISVPVIHPFIGRFAKITILWAVICIAYDFFFRKKMMKVDFAKLFISFGLFWLFSVLMNYENNLIKNLSFYAYGIVYIWILYPKYADKAEEKLEKFLHFFCVLTFVTSTVSVGMFMIQYKTLFDGFIVGYHMGRLYGVYVSPNTGGIYAFLSIVSSVIVLIDSYRKRTLKKKEKIFNSINIFMQISYIALTDSNGTKITYTAFVLLMVFCVLYQYLKEKKRALRVLGATVGAVMSAGICLGFFGGIGTVYSYFPNTINKIIDISADGSDEDELRAVAIRRQYEDEEFAAGRVEIWKTGLKVFKTSPLYGVAHENVQSVAKNVEPDREEITDKIASGMHNLYVEAIVETGIIGFSIFLIILISIGKKILRYYLCDKDILDVKMIILISLIGAMAINNFGECTILFCQSGIGIVFWLVLGYILGHVEEMEV